MRSLSCVVALSVCASPSFAAEGAKRWVCPSCGNPCDHASYDHPGKCPGCGMSLVAEGSERSRGRVAALIFDGVEIIDFTGPWEVFGGAGFEVYSVAKSRAAVTTSMGMTVVPNYAFADAPTADIVLIPGGGVAAARKDPATLAWIAAQNQGAQRTMSVCNGAFILASTHLLDGLGATTTAPLIERLGTEFPKVRVVDDRRYVDNGKLITTGGLSAGIDGALHVLETMYGQAFARSVALGVEYDWRPEAGFARAILADRNIPDLGLDDSTQWELTRYQGDADGWQLAARPKTAIDERLVLDRIGKALKAGGWTAGSGPDWRFKDRRGQSWTATLVVAAKDGVKLTLARVR